MWVSLKYTFFVTVGKTTGSYVATMVSPIRTSPSIHDVGVMRSSEVLMDHGKSMQRGKSSAY